MNAVLLTLAIVGQSAWTDLARADHKHAKHEAKGCTCTDCKPCQCGDLKARVASLESDVRTLKARLFERTNPPEPKSPFKPAVAPPVTPPDRWVPFAGNAAYEVFGHEDETGVFRYTQFRLKAGYTLAPYFTAPSSCPNGVCYPVRRW